MRIKLQTDVGKTYTIKRNDGERFIASRIQRSLIHSCSPTESEQWALWPKGHMEARKCFKDLHEALDHVIGGWWSAEGAS